MRLRAKAPRFGTSDGDAAGVAYLLGALLWVYSLAVFRVKTLARRFGFGSGGVWHRYPLGGVVEELNLPSGCRL